MKSYKIFFIVIALLSTFFVSCDINSPESLLFHSPECSIVSMSGITFEQHLAVMTISVINDGDGPTAFNVGCYIKLKNRNFILDDGYAGFDTLEEGEAREEEIRFYDLEENDNITNWEIVLYWYDAQDEYYSKNY